MSLARHTESISITGSTFESVDSSSPACTYNSQLDDCNIKSTKKECVEVGLHVRREIAGDELIDEQEFKSTIVFYMLPKHCSKMMPNK